MPSVPNPGKPSTPGPAFRNLRAHTRSLPAFRRTHTGSDLILPPLPVIKTLTMTTRSRLLPLLGLLLLALASPADAPPARSPHEETLESRRNFSLLSSEERRNPDTQWQRLQDLVQRKRLKAATRQAAYFADTWPDDPRAADAQRLRADLYFARGRFKEAFEAYQGLIDQHAGRFPYEEVIAQQVECATRLEHKIHSAFFGLSTWTDPLEAIPLYRQILTNAPRLALSPELLHRIGEIQFRKHLHDEAIAEFNLLEQRYPKSPYAEKAALRRADAFEEIVRKHPTDLAPLESARDALDHFLETYPESESRQEALSRRATAQQRLASLRFQQARFYEVRARNPQAALAAYRAFLQQFPDSEWTAPARERILTLEPKVD